MSGQSSVPRADAKRTSVPFPSAREDQNGAVAGDGLVRRDGDGWTFAISEPDLTFIRIDFQTRLRFGPTEVVIESPFQLEAHGQSWLLDPDDRAALGPLLALYPSRLDSCGADQDRVLRLTFDGGSQITVPPDPNYEAWSIVGPGTALVVCTPGSGDLAIWP